MCANHSTSTRDFKHLRHSWEMPLIWLSFLVTATAFLAALGILLIHLLGVLEQLVGAETAAQLASNALLMLLLPLTPIVFYIYRFYMAAQARANALLVGPNQFPDLFALYQDLARRLELPYLPRLYVTNGNGVVNAYARLAEEEYLDTIEGIDIVDINAGSHGRWFATNFDPEINFREFTGTVWSWQNGAWQANRMFEVGKEWDMPVVGRQKAYLTGHDEVHSLSARYPQADVRFWMGFGDHYINVFTVLKNLGLLSEQPVRTAEGQEVIPLKVVKAVLPDPASLAPDYIGKTCIGDFVKGTKDGKPAGVFIYNVADHKEAYQEVGSQGISYTAGVPPVAAAILIAQGIWDVKKMVNVEDLDPRPFIRLLNRIGLPTRVMDAEGDRPVDFA